MRQASCKMRLDDVGTGGECPAYTVDGKNEMDSMSSHDCSETRMYE